jgi:hypothetical protein
MYETWGSVHNYDNGKIDIEGSSSFVVARTVYGDGEYRDSLGFNYPVDSGCISLIPESMWMKTVSRDTIKELKIGSVLDVKKEVIFTAENGNFNILVDEAAEPNCIQTDQEDNWDGDGFEDRWDYLDGLNAENDLEDQDDDLEDEWDYLYGPNG